jgi:hypothetical protein
MREYFASFAGITRDSCAPYLLSLLCSQFLPTCTFDQNDHPKPRYPCSGFCPNFGLTDDKGHFGVPSECIGQNADYGFLFQHDQSKVVDDVTIKLDSFRPICWETPVRVTSDEKPWPIDKTSISPIQTYRDLDNSNGNLDQGTGITFTQGEKNIIAASDESCDPIYHQFPTQAAVISINSRNKQNKALGVALDLPTSTCPTLLTPLPRSEYTSDLVPCVVPCPNLTFTHHQYEQQDTLVIVFNSLSIICLFILCLSWTFFPALRLQNYVFYYILCISAMTLSLFILIPIARAQHKTIAASLCETPTQEYHMKGYPLFQGMVTAFTYMAATSWGLIMVFDIFVQVVIGKHMQKASREFILKERLYHGFSWFWGFYSLIGGLASEQFGATVSVGGSYALITPSRFQQSRGVFNAGNPFFYYPLLILTFISVFLMLVVLVKLIWFRSQTKTTGLRLATFVRLFIFIVANTFIICVFLVYSIDVTEKRGDLEDATTKYIECLHLVRTFEPGVDPISVCGEAPNHSLNFDILLLTVVLFNGMGVIAFLIYGTTTDLIYSWLGSLYVLFGFESFKKYEKDYRRNRKSTKMGTTKTSHHDKSRTSRSGHTSTLGSGLLTSQHHHDSTLDQSGFDRQPRGNRWDDDSRHQNARSPSQDPKSRGDISTTGQRKTVFQYGNNKQSQQQKRRPGVGLQTEASMTMTSPITHLHSATNEVELSTFQE